MKDLVIPKYKVGDKVRIKAKKTSSDGVKEHDGETVIIKAIKYYTKSTFFYILEEYPWCWSEGCFVNA